MSSGVRSTDPSPPFDFSGWRSRSSLLQLRFALASIGRGLARRSLRGRRRRGLAGCGLRRFARRGFRRLTGGRGLLGRRRRLWRRVGQVHDPLEIAFVMHGQIGRKLLGRLLAQHFVEQHALGELRGRLSGERLRLDLLHHEEHAVRAASREEHVVGGLLLHHFEDFGRHVAAADLALAAIEGDSASFQQLRHFFESLGALGRLGNLLRGLREREDDLLDTEGLSLREHQRMVGLVGLVGLDPRARERRVGDGPLQIHVCEQLVALALRLDEETGIPVELFSDRLLHEIFSLHELAHEALRDLIVRLLLVLAHRHAREAHLIGELIRFDLVTADGRDRRARRQLRRRPLLFARFILRFAAARKKQSGHAQDQGGVTRMQTKHAEISRTECHASLLFAGRKASSRGGVLRWAAISRRGFRGRRRKVGRYPPKGTGEAAPTRNLKLPFARAAVRVNASLVSSRVDPKPFSSPSNRPPGQRRERERARTKGEMGLLKRTNHAQCLQTDGPIAAFARRCATRFLHVRRNFAVSKAANLRLVEGTSVDKTKALDAALSQIERAFGKGSIMRLGKNQKPVEIETVSTGSLGLDIALGVGGLPRGRIVEIYGPESSGKTTLTLHVIAEAQKAGGVCAFVDAEHALDPIYAKKLGVQLDDLLISQPDTGEQALEITDTLVRSGAVDVLVVDSVAALTPRAEIEGEMGDVQPGLQARLMSQALRKLTASISRSNTMVIFINQIRMKIGVMYGSPETTSGGNALKFYASVRLDIRRVGAIKDRDEAVGNQTRVKVVKNKVAPPFKQVEFDIMYGEGISKVGELIDLGVKAGVVEKSGAWFSYDSQRLGQGRENAKNF